MRDAPTNDFDPWDRLDADRRAVYEKGEAAAQVLRKFETIERWHEVGDAAAALMDDVARYSGGKTSGKGYNHAWQRLSAHVPTVRDLDKSVRSPAVWMSRNWSKNQDNDNLPSITAWLATLTATERLTINHPAVVKRRYEAKHMAPTQGGASDKLSPIARERQKNGELVEENDRLKRELARRDAQDNAGSLFDLKKEPAKQIAGVIVNTVTDYKANEIHKALGAAIKEKRARAQAPAG